MSRCYNVEALQELLRQNGIHADAQIWGDEMYLDLDFAEQANCIPASWNVEQLRLSKFLSLWIETCIIMNKPKVMSMFLSMIGIDHPDLTIKEKLCLYYILKGSDDQA